MEALALRHGLELELVLAADSCDAALDPALVDVRGGVRRSKLALLTSRIATLQRFLSTNASAGLVMEDDVFLYGEADAVARLVRRAPPDGWDVIHLGNCRGADTTGGMAGLPAWPPEAPTEDTLARDGRHRRALASQGSITMNCLHTKRRKRSV